MYLPFRTNLTCLLLPHGFANVADGAAPGFWEDASGVDRDFSVSGAVVRHNALNGYPVLEFDGSNDVATSAYGAIASDFITASLGTVFTVFKAISIGTDLSGASIHNNDCLWSLASSTLNRAGVSLRSSGSVNAYNYDGAYESVANTISTGAWYIHMWRHGKTTNLLESGLDSPFEAASLAAVGNTGSLASAIEFGHSTSGSVFSNIQLAAWASFNLALADQDAATVVNFLTCLLGARGDAHEQARNVGSRHLWELREPRLVVTVPNLPLSALDLDVGDEFALVHPEIPRPGGLGAGPELWKREPLRVVSVTPELNALSVTIVAESLRMRRHRFYAAAKATKIQGQGLAFSALVPGPVLIKRVTPSLGGSVGDGKAYAVRTADGLVNILPDGEVRIEPNGVLCETDVKQCNQRSAFVSGSTGWTLTNPTGGTVAIEAVSASPVQLFDSAVTANCLKFTRGTSGTGIGESNSYFTPDSAAADVALVQIDYAGVETGFSYRFENGSQFWNDASGSWQAGAVDNPITSNVASQVPGVSQHLSKPIPWTNVLWVPHLSIRQATGVGSAGDVARVFNAGLMQDAPGSAVARLRWPISRMVADGTTAIYQGQDHGPLFPNHSGGRSWNNARGTALIKIRPRWATSDVVNVDSTALKFTLLHAFYDSNNEWWLHYYRDSAGGVGEVRFDVKAAGTTYRVSKSYTVSRDTLLAVGSRWTSAADGELGLAARTLSVFAAGVKGTDAQASAYPTESSISFLGVGAIADTSGPLHYELPLCGWWSSVEIFDECLTDAEIQAWGI